MTPPPPTQPPAHLFHAANFQPQKSYRVRTTHIYDPSKFWLTTKHRELDYFQKYLFKFYYINQEAQRIPRAALHLGQYCVAFVDMAFYRVRLTGYPHLHAARAQLQVLYIDFGMIGVVDTKDVFYLTEPAAKVPRFAVRACLAGVEPCEAMRWPFAANYRFSVLCSEKVLRMTVVAIDHRNMTLHVSLLQEEPPEAIEETLHSEKLLRFLTEKKTAEDGRLKYPFLFPSHEALESGKVPTSVSDAEYYAMFVMGSLLVKELTTEET